MKAILNMKTTNNKIGDRLQLCCQDGDILFIDSLNDLILRDRSTNMLVKTLHTAVGQICSDSQQ